MPIVGFSFTKIEVEKKPLVSQQVNIKNDLQLGNVELAKKNDYTTTDIVRFNFTFEVIYGEIGNINLTGYLVYSDDPEKLKRLVEIWEKEKRIPAILVQQVLNAMLVKCNIKALELAQDVGLPPHFELPKLKINVPKQEKGKKGGSKA